MHNSLNSIDANFLYEPSRPTGEVEHLHHPLKLLRMGTYQVVLTKASVHLPTHISIDLFTFATVTLPTPYRPVENRVLY